MSNDNTPTPFANNDRPNYETDPATGGVLIPVSSRKFPCTFALVDPEDVELVASHRWNVDANPRTKYAINVVKGRKPCSIFMHRLILGLTDRSMFCDHINHNGLDNRRCNLRIATHQQNMFHRRKNSITRADHRSEFKGVHWHKRSAKWQVNVGLNGRHYWVGLYADEIDAARAYDAAVRAHHGEFAVANLSDLLNFPDQPEREAA